MCGVPVALVHVVDVVAVRHCGMPAVLGVRVLVRLGRRVHALDGAFVVVIVVAVVGMPVVQVVDVVPVLHGGVPACGRVLMLVAGVRWSSLPFFLRVCDGIPHDVCHMGVAQCVRHLSSPSNPPHQAGIA